MTQPSPAVPPHAEPPRVEGPIVESPAKVLRSKSMATVLTVAGLVATLQWLPGLEARRLFDRPIPAEVAAPALAATVPSATVGEATLVEESADGGPALPDRLDLPAARGPIAANDQEKFHIDADQAPLPLEDEGQRGLAPFYRQLLATARKDPGAATRIIHFGDSIITGDFVSSTLRRELQRAFGDAGHGFILIANPWPAYHHQDVSHWATSGWKVSRVVGPEAADGRYGLGGVSFVGSAGMRARFGTAKSGEYGRRVDQFRIFYEQRPDGGELDLEVDGKKLRTLDTAGATEDRVEVVSVPDGEHFLDLAVRSKSVRAYGVAIDRAVPGVSLDAIGILGARVRFLDKSDDAHWARQLQLRAAHLLIYQFGANESGDGFLFPMDEYQATMTAVVQQGKKARPEAGCLIVGAMDRVRKVGTELRTLPVIPELVKRQRAVARETGCAFFDTYGAMGGENSMATWVRRGLGQADLIHPSGWGSLVLGKWLFGALMDGFHRFQDEGKAP